MRRATDVDGRWSGAPGDGTTVTIVNSDGLLRYLDGFHSQFTRSVERHVPQNYRQHLERSRLLGIGVIGYISTTYGAGFEYRGRRSTRIIEGPEAVFFLPFRDNPFPAAAIRMPMFQGAEDASNVRFSGLTLDGNGQAVVPFSMSGSKAELTVSDFRFQNRRYQRVVQHMELFGDNSAERWSPARAVEAAMDEVFSAYVHIREAEQWHLDLGQYVSQHRDRHVLLLGSFDGEGRRRLTSIRDALSGLGYLSTLLDEVEEFSGMDLLRKARLVADLSRFSVVDDSAPAGQIGEIPELIAGRCPLVILRLAGSSSSYVTRGLGATSKIVVERSYDATTLDSVMRDAVERMESSLGAVADEQSSTYPWRSFPK